MPLPSSLATAAPQDIVGYLKLQHEEIKVLFAETLAATGEERQAKFLALRSLIAAHEATEEELFHPMAERGLGANGHQVIVARLTEERAAATMITSLEGMALDTVQFELALRRLQSDVIEHAMNEEREEFPALVGMQSDGLPRVQAVARALYVDAGSLVQRARLTRDIGPFVAMLNRVRDVLAGRALFEAPGTEAQTAEEE